MSKFFKALEEAERSRALRNGTSTIAAGPAAPVVSLPEEQPAQAREAAADVPDGVDDHLVSLVTPAAFEAEQYRALRHVVEHRHKAAGLTVVAVSSPSPGDGKTLTAINLAGALAQAPEARVLLAEADLRRPSFGRLLGLPDSHGSGLVGAILNARVTLDQIVYRLPSFNLSVICAGATPPSPYDVLKSPRLGEFLDEARRRYDYIVLDTPPLVPVQDCRVIGRWVDGFLLVVAALRTPRRFVEEALTRLDRSKILGFVFNDEEKYSISTYHSKYSGYYTAGPSANTGHPGPLMRMASGIADSFWRRKPPGSARRPFHETGR